MSQEILDNALRQASTFAFADFHKRGYQKMTHPLNSYFHLLTQEEKPSIAIYFSVYIEPNISMELEIDNQFIIALADLIKQDFSVFCYHYNFDYDLTRNSPEVQQIVSPSEVVNFLESNQVIVHYKYT